MAQISVMKKKHSIKELKNDINLQLEKSLQDLKEGRVSKIKRIIE